MNFMTNNAHSPCVGVCVLEPKWSAYCIGCFRMTIEISNWAEYSDEEKSQINKRIEQLRKEEPEEYPYYK